MPGAQLNGRDFVMSCPVCGPHCYPNLRLDCRIECARQRFGNVFRYDATNEAANCSFPARIVHTSRVYRINYLIAFVAASGALSAACQTVAPAWPNAVDRAAREVPEARIVVLDIASGHLLAAHQLNDASRTLAAPGSTLKPLVLFGLVSAGRWNPASRIACSRQLVVAGHRLACTHPLAPPFDAREALTWSCNTYFAAVARTLRAGELGQLLRPTGLLGVTGLARDEAVAAFREPDSDDAKRLTLLGVEGVRVTPLELAEAYRWLAMELAAHPNSNAAQVVRAGLADSASFGMAGQASLGGVVVMGKTGTAEGVASSRTHGWFVGLAPAEKPRVVIAVYLPDGRGADAAHIAGEILANAPLRQP
jgi:cell division protein FtsI/penicillin-binding protein 2